MIGIVVVSHGLIGSEMVRVAQSIVKEPPPYRMVGVSIEHDEDADLTCKKIREAIQQVDQSDGILLLSDMFGGTPSNLCLSFLADEKVEVITGVNLPMLIKLLSLREKKPLSQMASFIRDYGQRNITLAGEVLKGGTHSGSKSGI